MGTPTLDPTQLREVKARQQRTWSAGDFSMVATGIVLVAEDLAEAVDLRPGWRVLDVATGSGNAALAAARRWCHVTGVDYVPALLDRGRERAQAERLTIEFKEGDAEELPFPDASFDAVLSTFGSMFAPDQERAAAELVRVCRPGGKIGMANWTPESWAGQMFRVVSGYLPPPPGLRPPTRWGTEEALRELFGKGVSSLRAVRRSARMRWPSGEYWLEYFRRYFGPVVRAYEALPADAQERLTRDLLDLAASVNQSGDDTLVYDSDYLEVVAVRA